MQLFEVNDWHGFRRRGIGSSDAGVIMGTCSWKTKYFLWKEKAEGFYSIEKNYAMQRGLRLEPIARAQYERMRNVVAAPAYFVHDEYSFVRATLDGWIPKQRKVLEIKCPGKGDHAMALDGEIPPKYKAQLQHQLFTTGAESLDYYSFDGRRGVIVTVYPDSDYIASLLEAETAFWNLVLTKTPPDMKKQDVLEEHPIYRKWRAIKRKSVLATNL